jgi:hypothetical protein
VLGFLSAAFAGAIAPSSATALGVAASLILSEGRACAPQVLFGRPSGAVWTKKSLARGCNGHCSPRKLNHTKP